jgi:hypothetical protein
MLNFKISIPDKLNGEDVRILLHDLRSAANAFNMMVEDIGLDLQNLKTPRQQTKFQQLQEHALNTEKIIAKICDEISKERN